MQAISRHINSTAKGMTVTAHRQAGFNLIELMITIAVAAILLALAVPSFSDFFDKYRLRGAADDIVSTLANARAAAVKSDRSVDISFGGNATNWCVGAQAAVDPTGGARAVGPVPCDCTSTVATTCVVAGQRLAINQDAHAGVSLDAIPDSFVFDSKMGMISSEADVPDAITLTSPAGKYVVEVRINMLGQSFVCVPATLPTGKRVLTGVQTCS